MDATAHNSWYNRVFASFYDKVMAHSETKILQEHRKRLLSILQGKILEIGCGTGINFPLYSKGATVIACEPSVAMFEKAQVAAKSQDIQAEINLVNMGLESDVLYKLVKKESLDAVVCTLVLCTIPDLNAAIKEIKYFLKPGGKLLVLEHIKAHSDTGMLLQNTLNPLWNLCADGCNLNRPTDLELKKAGLKVIEEEFFYEILPFYSATMVK